MERIPNDSTDRVVFFVAVDVTDLYTRETGLSSFTVDYVLDNGARAQMTTPTTAAIDDTNLPGLYSLAIDEAGMTNMDAANDEETLVLHITHASIAPVTMKVSVYRPKITAARTLGIDADGALSVCTLNTDMVGTDNAATEAKQDIIDTNIDQIETAVITNATGVDIAADIIAVKAETALIVADTDVIDDGTSGLVKIASDVAAVLTDTGTTLENRLIAIENDTDVIDDATSGLVKIASDVADILVDTGTTLPDSIAALPAAASGPRIE